jgi:hypothetical protein
MGFVRWKNPQLGCSGEEALETRPLFLADRMIQGVTGGSMTQVEAATAPQHGTSIACSLLADNRLVPHHGVPPGQAPWEQSIVYVGGVGKCGFDAGLSQWIRIVLCRSHKERLSACSQHLLRLVLGIGFTMCYNVKGRKPGSSGSGCTWPEAKAPGFLRGRTGDGDRIDCRRRP